VSGGGKAKYDAKRHALVWKFKKFPGETEASLMANVELIATTKEKRSWARPPIELQFQVRRSVPQLPPSFWRECGAA
jgi:AP-2 complex subunit mu-1